MDNEEILEGCAISREEHYLALLRKDMMQMEKHYNYRLGHLRQEFTDYKIAQSKKNQEYSKHGNKININTWWIGIISIFAMAIPVQLMLNYVGNPFEVAATIEKVDQNGTNSRH